MSCAIKGCKSHTGGKERNHETVSFYRMELPAKSQNFRLYVTHVDAEDHFLKISGQLEPQSSLIVDRLIDSVRDDLDKGIGSIPAVIQEGTICAVKYKDGKYYRAKITNTRNLSAGLVGVHFIDYGNKVSISLSAIRFVDAYDTMFVQLRGQATDFYLTRIMHPSGYWDESLLLKLQGWLCYAEFPAAIEGKTRTLSIISLQYRGNDFTTHLVSNKFGIAVPVAKQEVMWMQPTEDSLYANHVPYEVNWNFPSNPELDMNFHSAIVPPPSPVSQRLLVNKKASIGSVNFRPPLRRQDTVSSPPDHTANPALEAPFQQSATYKSQSLEIKSQVDVCVSFAEEGPELFAVQLLTDAKELQDMMNDINLRPHSCLAKPPMIGTICLGRMSRDKIICRAIITNVSRVQCKLYFVDFGDTEMVSYYDIFDIPEEFVKPIVSAVRFCLSGVEKLEKGPYLNEAFKQLVTGKVMTLRVVAPEGPPLIHYGELYLDNKNVLDLLLTNLKDTIQFKWMEMLPVGSRASVLVSYVDSCIKFYVQLSDKTDGLNAVMKAVKTHCESTSSSGELRVGAACCARLPENGEWYRNKVLGSKANRILVAYVDYGNHQEVDNSALRTITSALIKLPVQALKCALKGFGNRPLQSETSNQLETLVREKILTMSIVGVVSSDTMLVYLVDDTAVPPLDVAREIVEGKPTTPVSEPAHEHFSWPETERGEATRENSFRDRRGQPWESTAATEVPHSRGRDHRENSVKSMVRRFDAQMSCSGDTRGGGGDRTRSDFSSDSGKRADPSFGRAQTRGTPEPLTELEPETFFAAKLSDGNRYRAIIASAAGSDVAGHVLKKLDVNEPCAQTLHASLDCNNGGLCTKSEDGAWFRAQACQSKSATPEHDNKVLFSLEKAEYVPPELASREEGVLCAKSEDGAWFRAQACQSKSATPEHDNKVLFSLEKAEYVPPELASREEGVLCAKSEDGAWFRAQACQSKSATPEHDNKVLFSLEKAEYVPPELASREEGVLCAKSEDGAWFRAQACQSEFATPELQAMKAAWEVDKAKCKEFRELPDDARNKLAELMADNSSVLIGDNEKQNEVDTKKK